MSQHTFAEKTSKTKGKIGNENEVEVSAIFVMLLDYACTPIFLRHFIFHNSCFYILLLLMLFSCSTLKIPHIQEDVILTCHIENEKLWVTQYEMLTLLWKTETKGQCGLNWFAQGHIGSVESEDKSFMFCFHRRE